jgi:hypothetical protein
MSQYPYILISFAWDEYLKQAPLVIEPKPDSIQRIFVVRKWLQEQIPIAPQLLYPFQRSWYSVIELGGMEWK